MPAQPGYKSSVVTIASRTTRWLGVMLLAGLAIASSGAQAEVILAVPENMLPAMTRLVPLISGKADIALRVRGGEESNLIVDVSHGNLPFAIVCRPLSATELNSVEAHLIGYDGVAVIVNGRNPVSNLEAEQLAGIYAQRITRWKAAGGVDKPVVSIVKEVQALPSGASESLLPLLGASAKGAHVVNADLPTILFVAVDPYAIGYVGIGEASLLISEGARIKVLTIGGKGPSPDQLRSRVYPLSWPVYLIAGRKLGEEERRMKAYLLGHDGQRALAEAGLVPVKGGNP